MPSRLRRHPEPRHALDTHGGLPPTPPPSAASTSEIDRASCLGIWRSLPHGRPGSSRRMPRGSQATLAGRGVWSPTSLSPHIPTCPSFCRLRTGSVSRGMCVLGRAGTAGSQRQSFRGRQTQPGTQSRCGGRPKSSASPGSRLSRQYCFSSISAVSSTSAPRQELVARVFLDEYLPGRARDTAQIARALRPRRAGPEQRCAFRTGTT